MLTLAILVGLTTGAYADDNKTLDERVSALENNMPNIPQGFFVNGNIEGFYDDKTYDSGWDSRGEVQLGIETMLPDNHANINWAGGSFIYDSHYALDTTLNDKMVEKQLGFGNDHARLYIGETDAQRMGFAKTPKISAPLIFTETNYRIDHRE